MTGFNLNRNYGVSIAQFENGKTQNIPVKIGRTTFLMDIDKNADSCAVDLYKKVKPARADFSKYSPEADRHGALVKNNAVLTKAFFKEIAEIESAQRIALKWYKTAEFFN